MVVSGVRFCLGAHSEMESPGQSLTFHRKCPRLSGAASCRGSRECQTRDAGVIEGSGLQGYGCEFDTCFIGQNSYQVTCSGKKVWTMAVSMVPKQIKQASENHEGSFLYMCLTNAVKMPLGQEQSLIFDALSRVSHVAALENLLYDHI